MSDPQTANVSFKSIRIFSEAGGWQGEITWADGCKIGFWSPTFDEVHGRVNTEIKR